MLALFHNYRSTSTGSCSVFRLLAVLAVFAMTLGLKAQEYEVDGKIDLRLFLPDKSLANEYQGSFRVYVKGCAWLIQVTEMNNWRLPLRREVGTMDGKEMYEMVVPYEPISPSDPIVFQTNALPQDISIARMGAVAPKAIPVGELDSSFTGHLWLMFASGFYLCTAVPGQLTPVFEWYATPHMNNDSIMKATWQLISTSGSLPSRVTFFKDNGTPEAVYEATGFTNVGALRLPNGFHFTEPGQGYKEVIAVVTAVRPICSRGDLRPALKQMAIVSDMRWYDKKHGDQFPLYEADHWPTVKQAQKLYHTRKWPFLSGKGSERGGKLLHPVK